MNKTVLIVDDEKTIVDILRFNLEKNHYNTLYAYDGLEGLKIARDKNPGLILLDVMLPHMDGFEVCKTLRSEGNNIPIIMITAREEETDKVLGLELGADDYITKPFSMREVVARVNANIRRATNTDLEQNHNIMKTPHSLGIDELIIDVERYLVFKRGKAVDLTQREYDLLKFLAERPGKIISRQELLSEVWRFEYYGDQRAVDVAVRRLREKVEDDPANPVYVLTKRGVGYFFREF